MYTHTYIRQKTHRCCAAQAVQGFGMQGCQEELCLVDFESRFETFYVRLYCEVDETLSQWLFMGRNIHTYMYIYMCVCHLKWKRCLNCTNLNKCIARWELDAKGTVQRFLASRPVAIRHEKTNNASMCARLFQPNAGVIFLLSDTNHLPHFTIFVLRTCSLCDMFALRLCGWRRILMAAIKVLRHWII